MDKDKLNQLRQEIVSKIEEIAQKGDVSPSIKIIALMQLVRDGSASLDMYRKIYETTDLVEDEQERLNVYLDLLYEVDSSEYSAANGTAALGEELSSPSEALSNVDGS